MLKKICIQMLRYGIHVFDLIISFLDLDKSRVDFGAYRVELKFFLEQYIPQLKGKILDVGSGDWVWTKEKLSKYSCAVISFDKYAHKNVDVVGDIYELSKHFQNDCFDGIICTDVIEHVSNPFLALEQMSSVLKPGGIILFSCPFDKELHGENYGDYWRVTRQGWGELLKSHFENLVITWWGPEQKPKSYFIKAEKKLL